MDLSDQPFDPLTVENVGVTLAVELLERPLSRLDAPPFKGAGVYALYYTGKHAAYASLVALDRSKGGWKYPVYIGSAVRENAKQGFNPRASKRSKIWERLKDHAASIREVEQKGFDPDFKLEDFRCRYLVLNDAYIALAESVLITTFRPAWNGMGLGSKVVGGHRMKGLASLWDSLHPGRSGRPAGTTDRGKSAASKIRECIEQLKTDPADPITAKMVEKIRRFL